MKQLYLLFFRLILQQVEELRTESRRSSLVSTEEKVTLHFVLTFFLTTLNKFRTSISVYDLLLAIQTPIYLFLFF